jgi:hypothetical protein
VGLSPEVAIYTHGYWQSQLEGYPCKRAPVEIHDESIIGFRSILLPGAMVACNSVVGAGSVVVGKLSTPRCVWAGNPAKLVKEIPTKTQAQKMAGMQLLLEGYLQTLAYRNIGWKAGELAASCDSLKIAFRGFRVDLETGHWEGTEDDATDDFRWFLFTHGVRIYTSRPFAKLEKQ